MNPKQTQDSHNSIGAAEAQQNMLALAHYARLLRTCGVRQLTIVRLMLVP